MEGQLDQSTPYPPVFTGHSDEEIIIAILDLHKPSKNPVVRWLWTGLGCIFVVFALIGILLPGWPTISWLVAAGFCFGRSSRRMFRWLLTNRLFGNSLLEYYKAGQALPFHSKMVIITIILLVSIFSIYALTTLGDPGFGQTSIAVAALIGVWFVGWKVPTIQAQIE